MYRPLKASKSSIMDQTAGWDLCVQT